MKLLDQLPISDERTSLRFGGRYITVRHNQILVWMSVDLSGIVVPQGNMPRFPALLDTGNNFAFSMQDRHLREWAGIAPDLLTHLGNAEINGQFVTRREATVWLHPNIPGRQDVAADRPPFRLEMRRGIAVYTQDTVPTGPRSPLLGLPALVANDLDCWIDPERRQVTVQTRRCAGRSSGSSAACEQKFPLRGSSARIPTGNRRRVARGGPTGPRHRKMW